jgi:hypothetical protein
MDEHYEEAFWETIYNEYGVVDEIDVLNEEVQHVIYPAPGIIILLTGEFYGKKQD